MIDLSKVELPAHLAKPDPDLYNHGSYVVLDWETTNIAKGSAQYEENDIVLGCWEVGCDDPEMHYCWGGTYEQQAVIDAIERADFFVAHNAKFELQWLKRCGVDISKLVVFDTMIAEYVLGGNLWSFRDVSLGVCASRRNWHGKGDLVGRLLKGGVCPSTIPKDWLLKYCIRDVELTRELFQHQLAELNKLNLLPVMFTRCLATPVLADIEFNGMQLDPECIINKTEEMERDYVRAQEELDDLTGGINLNSPKQLGPYLYDELELPELKDRKGNPIRSSSGGRRTDQATIGNLKGTTKKQKDFISKYKLNKSMYNELTKYLRKFVDCCNESGGLLRAQFNQCATKTHRLSSSGLDYSCQFQNFPRTYKPFFKARNEGWLVGEGDGAQLEFRVAAHNGRDEVALSDITNKVDIHKFTASKINGCREDEVTGKQRQEAKADTFKPLYGGQSGTPAQQRYYKAFKEKYAGITATQETWINDVVRDKMLVTEWGLRYYWPDVRVDRSGYVSCRTSVCNYPVQALATAEIVPVALVYFYHYIKALGLEMFIVNTIHDSIICELPPGEVDAFHQLSRECLIHRAGKYLKDVYDMDFVAPLGAGVKTGSHWGVGDEVVYED